jgi:hypothetical protein
VVSAVKSSIFLSENQKNAAEIDQGRDESKVEERGESHDGARGILSTMNERGHTSSASSSKSPHIR